MRTQLRAFGAFAGGRYGSFADKSQESHPVGVLTQPGAFGAHTGRRYGSFAGRASAEHPVGRITQARAFGAFSGRRYGSFARAVSEDGVPVQPVIGSVRFIGAKEDEDDFLLLIGIQTYLLQ